jgi:CRISPR-associated exonuclease Cas4
MSDIRLIPLSALQHYDFCPRQCALIHNEQVWAENYLTAQGQLLHERVDGGMPETRKGIRYERGVAVSVPKLGLTGKLDLVERELDTGNCFPVEYKRGKPKVEDCDRIQLCAQGLCLEEMLERPVNKGALWYWQTRHREVINFDAALRQKTLDVIAAVRVLFDSGKTPKAKFEKKCKACSLLDLCNPTVTGNDKSRTYAQALFNPTELTNEETTE